MWTIRPSLHLPTSSPLWCSTAPPPPTPPFPPASSSSIITTISCPATFPEWVLPIFAKLLPKPSRTGLFSSNMLMLWQIGNFCSSLFDLGHYWFGLMCACALFVLLEVINFFAWWVHYIILNACLPFFFPFGKLFLFVCNKVNGTIKVPFDCAVNLVFQLSWVPKRYNLENSARGKSGW